MAWVSSPDKTRLVRGLATDVGFDRVGIARAEAIARADYLNRWLAAGRAGTMEYLHRNGPIREDPRRLVEGARSVIVVAMNYHQVAPQPTGRDGPRGRVAMYAWGADYHEVVKERLHRLADGMRAAIDEPFEARCCVDTVPIMERELAAAAGIGWIGKNTMVLHQELGSYFFLGEVVTTLELVPDAPLTDRCGTCTRCLEACPTGAFPAAYEMDASLCVSYLTIEHRGEIAASLHRSMGDWIFGCDVCQRVCPYNRDAPISDAFSRHVAGESLGLDEVERWSVDDYRRVLKHSAVKRAKPEMLRRNAGIVRGNAT